MAFQGNRSIVWLCLLLWISSVAFVAIGGWVLAQGATQYGLLAFAVAGLMAASGTGLYRQRRWGVALFGALALLGSTNHMITTLTRYADLSEADPLRIFSAMVSLLLAILIPVALIYLTLLLWRQAR